MVTYFYKWTPLVVVAAIVILSLPWLGLVALMFVVLVLLPALAWAIVVVPYMLGRAISRRWQESGPSHKATAALSPATHESAFQEAHKS
jgi:hypothetical protein